MTREDTADYLSLFLQDTPLIDTRAPVEFARGAFPGAVNLPLMTDDERRQVGILYKQRGQSAAIALGHRLVAGKRRAQRIESWCRFARQHPDGYLYCFRGGLRSATARQWMREAGTDYPLVRGGYKAMRRFLLERLDSAVRHGSLLLVAGKTGAGKTRVLQAVPDAVDLEGMAGHRGSSFGRLLDKQPSQIDFENALAIRLLRLEAAGISPFLLEDEGRLIGRVSLPDVLREKMTASPLLLVEEPRSARVRVIYEDYVVDLGARYRARHGAEGHALHQRHLRDGLARIRKRLGGALYAEIDALMKTAFSGAPGEDAERLHGRWIEPLLAKYYDPMYDYQMARRDGRILGRGRRMDIIEQARELLAK